jgi:hypothetical protein
MPCTGQKSIVLDVGHWNLDFFSRLSRIIAFTSVICITATLHHLPFIHVAILFPGNITLSPVYA